MSVMGGSQHGASAMSDFRIEHDSMGEVRVPADALWRAQTQRAVENFPISGTPIEPALIHAIGRVKAAAARVNGELGILEPRSAPRRSSRPRAVGRRRASRRRDFPIDVFQTGSAPART